MDINDTINNTEELSEHLKSQFNAMKIIHPSDDFDQKMIGIIQKSVNSTPSSRETINNRWVLKLIPAIAASILLVFIYMKPATPTFDEQLVVALSDSAAIESNLSLTNKINSNPLLLAEMDVLMSEIESLDSQLQKLYQDDSRAELKLALVNKRLILLDLLGKLHGSSQELFRI